MFLTSSFNEIRILRSSTFWRSPIRAVNDLTWEFKLRKGVKFHNGEDFDAGAVKFVLERMADPTHKLRQTVFQGVIDRVDIADDYTVRIVTKKPYPVMDAILCIYGQPVPPKYFQEKGAVPFATNPIGTGPSKFVKWIKDDQILLEANEQYWRGAPKIKKVIFRPIPEATTRVAGLKPRNSILLLTSPSSMPSDGLERPFLCLQGSQCAGDLYGL